MFGTRWLNLLSASVLAFTLLLGAAGAAFARPLAAPGPIGATAPCYRAAREDLETVLPSGWRGYTQQATCSQIAQPAESTAAQAVPAALQPSAAASQPARIACYRTLRDLGTVLPGYESSVLLASCNAATQANVAAR